MRYLSMLCLMCFSLVLAASYVLIASDVLSPMAEIVAALKGALNAVPDRLRD